MSQSITRQTKYITAMDAQAATGLGKIMNVSEYRTIMLEVSTASNANFTLKVKGSIDNGTAPTFVEASQTVANAWSYVQAVDMADGTKIDGGTGVSSAGTDIFKLYEVNVNALDHLTVDVTTYAAGDITVRMRAVDNT